MTVTHWILIGATTALIGFDIYAARAKELPTISQVIWKTGRKSPTLYWVAGVLCGHLFWPG